MIKINKININISKEEFEIGDSLLEFNISGNNIDYIIVNTLRRTIYSDIPIYVLTEYIFEKNNSIFHNNYLKNRISNLPIWGIDNNIDFIHNDIDINVDNENDKDNNISENDEDFFDEVDSYINENENKDKFNNLKEFSLYLNFKNNTNDIITVTTDDSKFYYEQKLIKSPYVTPLPLIKLNKNEEILFTAISKIGTEEQNGALFSAVCIASFKMNDDNNFKFTLESRGQINEKRIINVAIFNIKKKLNNLVKFINKNNNNDDDDDNYNDNEDDEDEDEDEDNKDNNNKKIILNNEGDTLGNLISRGLQLHEDISFAGYNLPHPLIKKVHIHYRLKNEKSDIKKIIIDVVEYYKKIFNTINKSFL